MGHFGAVFKLDLTEETRTQLQEEAVGYGLLYILSAQVTFTLHEIS